MLFQAQWAARLEAPAVQPRLASRELAWCRACARTTNVAYSRAVSETHRRVAAWLRAAGVEAALEAEVAEGVWVDLLVQDSGLCIEVDGPAHFVTSLDGRRTWLAGPSLLKRRLLAREGWRVVSFPYWQLSALQARTPDRAVLADTRFFRPFNASAGESQISHR